MLLLSDVKCGVLQLQCTLILAKLHCYKSFLNYPFITHSSNLKNHVSKGFRYVLMFYICIDSQDKEFIHDQRSLLFFICKKNPMSVCILYSGGARFKVRPQLIYILWHSLLVNGWMEGRGGDCFLPILSSWSTNSSSQTKYFLTFFAISFVICIFFPLLASFTGCLKHDLFQDIINRCWEFHWYFDSVWRNDSWELRLMTKYSPDSTRMWG